MHGYNLLGALLIGAFAGSANGAEPVSVLVPGEVYKFESAQREGFEQWSQYLFCRSAEAAFEATTRALDHIEGFEDEHGHHIGSHVDFPLAGDKDCEHVTSIEFRLAASQPEQQPLGVVWTMVFLPKADAHLATHRCGGRVCALAPRPRKFIAVQRLGADGEVDGFLAVIPTLKIESNKGG